MMNKYYAGMGDKHTNKQIAYVLSRDPVWSIRLAASYMRHLKETVTVTHGNKTRHINDWEAAVAYAVNPIQFGKWLSGGPPPSPETQKRWDAIFGTTGTAAFEY